MPRYALSSLSSYGSSTRSFLLPRLQDHVMIFLYVFVPLTLFISMFLTILPTLWPFTTLLYDPIMKLQKNERPFDVFM